MRIERLKHSCICLSAALLACVWYILFMKYLRRKQFWRTLYLCVCFSSLSAKPKGIISLSSVCMSVCLFVRLSVRLSVIPLSVFRTFLRSGWRYSAEIWYMTTSQWVTDQVWASFRLTNFWLNYSPWCSNLVFRICFFFFFFFFFFFCPKWSEESEIF
jgi:hypothetical protein